MIFDPTTSLQSYQQVKPHVVFTREEIEQAFNEEKFPLSLQSQPFDEDTFIYLCEAVWAKGNTLFIIDEADSVMLSSNAKYLPPVIQNILSRSRHRNLHVMMAVRRPYEVAATVRGFAEQFIVFQTWLKRDIEAIEDTIGIDAPNLRALENGEFYILPEPKKEQPKKVKS